MRFTGEFLDFPIDLYHLRARQYSPETGRFLTTDPLAPEIDDPYVSAYVYVNNRPTILVDPCVTEPQRIRQTPYVTEK